MAATQTKFPYVPEPLKPNKYTPTGPTLAGEAKCAKKGHRPPNKYRFCTRCLKSMVAPTELV
jgi:hypothetical protein